MRRVTDSTRCACAGLALFLTIFGNFVSAQTTDQSTPNPAPTDKTTNLPQPERKSFLHFDTTPTTAITAPRAVDVSGQNFSQGGASEGKVGTGHQTNGEIVVAPFPISNPALGSGLVVVAGYLFPISKGAEDSPDSMVGGGTFYTSNGSWLGGIGTKLYLKQDRFRLTAAYGRAQVHYDLYGIGNAAGNLGIYVPINQGGRAVLAESLVRLKGDFFVGPRYQWRSLNAGLNKSLLPELNIDPVELKSTTASLGFHVQRDLRNSQFYPTAGTLFDVLGDFFEGAVFSSFSYQSYTFAFNKYAGFTRRQVVAFRIFGCATAGHVPFYDLCMLGMHDDIRGYKTGRFRDKLMLTTQAEYRLELPKRFGLAAFFGVGEVAPDPGAFNNDNLKPGGGAGIRYILAKKNHINLRVDYAAGLQGGGVYMGVTEAF